MPRQRNKNIQTDYDLWVEHQIKEGIENFVSKFKSQFEDQLSQLQSDIENLKLTVDHLTKENETLNNLQQASDCAVEQLQDRVNDLEESSHITSSRLHRQLEEKDDHIRIMMKKIDQLEQGTKSNNIRIAGMIEEDEEDIRSKVMSLMKDQLKIRNMKVEDIKDVGRMGKKRQDKTRDVIVKFNNNTKREHVYRKRKLLINRNQPLFINEDLTDYRSQLFYEARKLRKRGHLFGVWTQQGNVMVKQTESDNPRAVGNHNELKTMCHVHEEVESDDDASMC